MDELASFRTAAVKSAIPAGRFNDVISSVGLVG